MIKNPILSISRFFCTQKSYTSTFKIRSRLTQFFKHVHPDQLTQAPTKIKQQNLRSLTNFNSYIDSIAQSKSSQAKLLKFYIAEKTNLKSKKFFSFSVELPELKAHGSEMNEQKAKKLVDNIVQVLNRKFVESKNFRTKHGKTSQKQIQRVQSIKIQEKLSEEQRIQKETSTIKPFNKNSRMTAREAQNLKNTLNSKYMQAEKQSLSSKLLKTISFADTGRNKPMMWSRITGGKGGIYEDYKRIMDDLIDPRLIYFDETLTTQQIQQFKKRLLPGEMSRQNYRDSKIIVEVCAKMESFQPPLCFYVSKKYSSTDIPGFLTIPYNFTAIDLGKYFEQQISNVLAEQHKFQQYFDYYNDLKATLQSENNLFFDEIHFKNNSQIWGYILMLKRLQKYSVSKKTGVVVFDKEQYQIFLQNYKLNNEKNMSVTFYESKIITRIDFVEEDMAIIIERLNENYEKSKVN